MEEHFEREFQQHVPARGLTGAPPRRKLSVDFKMPAGHTIKRALAPDQHGAVVTHKNLDGLAEVRLSFAEIPNGVHIEWELKNPESLPWEGRTASLTVGLVGLANAVPPPVVLQGFSQAYEAIHQRFFADFFYAGHVADWIEGSSIKFGDQTIYMGQALIFLATELAIRRRLGHDPQPASAPMREILDAIDQLDLDAEKLYGFSPALDGFIVRDNITGPADPRLQGRFSVVESDWQTPKNAAPSGDQIFGLMFGLWFVVRFSGDDDLTQRARELSDRMFRYAQRCKFVLTLPDGKPTMRGSDMRWLASLLHGLNKDITGIDRFDDCRIELGGLMDSDLHPIAAFWDQVGSSAEQILRTEVTIPLLGDNFGSKTYKVKSFAEHILLMALAPSDVCSEGEFERAAVAVDHQLAVLFYSLAHDTKPDLFTSADIQAILDKCPDEGPRGDLPTETGWQQDNRWIRCSDIDEPGSGTPKRYFGVDFLMLHNLAQIVFGQ
jgi:hypothetical protein